MYFPTISKFVVKLGPLFPVGSLLICTTIFCDRFSEFVLVKESDEIKLFNCINPFFSMGCNFIKAAFMFGSILDSCPK